MTAMSAAVQRARDVLLGAITAVQVAWCRMRYPRRRLSQDSGDDESGPLLVIRCEAKLGDNLLTIPFLRALRARHPTRPIHLLHHTAARAVYERCPYIDRRIEINWAMSSPVTLLRRVGLAAAAFASRPTTTRYALAFAPRWDEDLYAPFLGRASGAARFVGFSRQVLPAKARRNVGVDSLMTHAVDNRRVLHESIRPFTLLDPSQDPTAGSHAALEFWHSDRDTVSIAAPIEGTAAKGTTWIAVGPGAAVDRRQWPVSMFADLVAALSRRPGVRFAFLGSAGESEDCEALVRAAASNTALNLAGRLTLAQCAQALSRCHLFIGNDSGLMHLASAAGTPIVEISCHPIRAPSWHANSPTRFGAAGERCAVLRPAQPASSACREGCVSSVAHCIVGVTVESAVGAANTLLDVAVSPLQAPLQGDRAWVG